MTGDFNLLVDTCDIRGIKAINGNGGVVYLPTSALTSVVNFVNSVSYNTSSSAKGGFGYIGATTTSDILIDSSSQIDTSSSGTEGGVFYLQSTTSNFKLD